MDTEVNKPFASLVDVCEGKFCLLLFDTEKGVSDNPETFDLRICGVVLPPGFRWYIDDVVWGLCFFLKVSFVDFFVEVRKFTITVRND